MGWHVRTRISLLVAIPLASAIFVSTILIRDLLSKRRQADEAFEIAELYGTVSPFLHESQRERGKTALFLAGEVSLAELETQRSVLASHVRTFETLLKERKSLQSLQASGAALVKALEIARKAADARQEGISVTALYNQLNASLIAFEASLAHKTSFRDSQLQLIGLTVLESAKESAGRLRATTLNILNKNVALTPLQISTIENYKAGLEANLNSPGLVVSQEGRAKLNNLLGSKAWKIVLRVYGHVLEKAGTGSFEENPKAFYAAITEAIDELGAILTLEIDTFEKGVASASDELHREAQLTILVITLSLLGAMLLTFFSLRAITRPLADAISRLEGISGKIEDAILELETASSQLASSAVEQASSLQETASSMEEIGASLKSTTDSVERASEISQICSRAATEGQKIVAETRSAIEALATSTVDAGNQSDRMNVRIGDVQKIIIEIENKAKVIHEIVFQTKLLSFNASVEAARAGEHGKGFSVVAEEVGNLAQMSGQAATEIGQMLERSRIEVDAIALDLKDSGEKMVRTIRGRTDVGVDLVTKSHETLEQVVSYVQKSTEDVNDIARSSREQSRTVEQISQAIGQIDVATQQNAIFATETASQAASLSNQSSALRGVVTHLIKVLEGDERTKDLARETRVRAAT